MAKQSISTGQWSKFFELMSQLGVTDDEFQLRLSTGALADLFDPTANLADRKAWRSALNLSTDYLGADISAPFRLVVDYVETLQEMFHGRISYSGHSLPELMDMLPAKNKRVVEFEACYFFPRKKSWEEIAVLAPQIDIKNPWGLGGIEHLISQQIATNHSQTTVAIRNLVGGEALGGFRRQIFPTSRQNGYRRQRILLVREIPKP